MTDLLESLSAIFAERLLVKQSQLTPFESDGLTAFKSRPAAVVMPVTQQEVIQAVRLCYEHQVPFVARGSGTSLSGGSVPVEGGVLIALNKLNRVLHYDPAAGMIVVEPGVINQHVSNYVSKDGLYYAPDPSSGPVCTIGGNVAFNSGGAHCLKYGMTSNHVLALKLVTPTGEVISIGQESLEPIGPDLCGLFVGSEGLLGVALEITLRLLPKVETYRTVMAAYASLADAGDAVAAIIAKGLLPGAMEIMDRLAMDAAEAAVHAGYPADAQGLLIVELEGPEEEVAVETSLLMEIIEASGAYHTIVAQNEAERQRIWKGRKGAFSAVGRLSPDYIVQDGVVPRSQLAHALSSIQALSQHYGLGVANVFHAGDGNLHPLILYNGQIDGEYEKAEELAAEILRLCIKLGGSITGEHGVGLEKRAYLPEMFNAQDMQLMQDIRTAIDPKQLANYGKMLIPVTDGRTKQ